MNLLKSQCPIPYPMTEVMILTEQAVNVGIRSGNPKKRKSKSSGQQEAGAPYRDILADTIASTGKSDSH